MPFTLSSAVTLQSLGFGFVMLLVSYSFIMWAYRNHLHTITLAHLPAAKSFLNNFHYHSNNGLNKIP